MELAGYEGALFILRVEGILLIRRYQEMRNPASTNNKKEQHTITTTTTADAVTTTQRHELRKYTQHNIHV